MLDRQKVYDKARVGMIKQGSPCKVNGSRCVYTNENEEHCALGFNIPKEYYFPEMEGQGAWKLLTNHPMLCEYFGINFEEVRAIDWPAAGSEDPHVGKSGTLADIHFLTSLQNIHDSKDPEDWPILLITFAEKWGLRP
jgi:hypothetical protein